MPRSRATPPRCSPRERGRGRPAAHRAAADAHRGRRGRRRRCAAGGGVRGRARGGRAHSAVSGAPTGTGDRRADPDRDDLGGFARAEALSRRLDTPMGVLALVFLLVVLGQVLATDPATVTGLAVAGWALWSVFVAEFVLRAVVARDTAGSGPATGGSWCSWSCRSCGSPARCAAAVRPRRERALGGRARLPLGGAAAVRADPARRRAGHHRRGATDRSRLPGPGPGGAARGVLGGGVRHARGCAGRVLPHAPGGYGR